MERNTKQIDGIKFLQFRSALPLSFSAADHFCCHSFTTASSNGEDGKTSYLHIKYSNDGGVTFTGNNGEDPGA